MTNVQSVVSAKAAAKTIAKGKAKANGSTAMTAAQACAVAFEYGQTMAGQDGALTVAFATFKANETVLADMVQALTEGYFVRKLNYTRDEAKAVIGKAKYNHLNPAKNTDDNRTAEQEKVMGAVRTLVSRAKRLAGLTEAKPETVAKAEAKADDAKAHEQRLIKADALINPADDVDPFEALTRLVSTMKSLQNKYAAKLTGDRGAAWRDWLAAAPKA